jgi:hypothetical protein
MWVPDAAYCGAETEVGAATAWLPEMRQLLAGVEGVQSIRDLDRIDVSSPERVTSYCAQPDPNLPFLKFRVSRADAKLLAFAGKVAPGFDVLDVFLHGFQYHWRRDLVRSFEQQAAFVSRICGLSDTGELVFEHLSLPIVRKGRVREVRGWLVSDQDLGNPKAICLDGISMFRRPERSHRVRLPGSLINDQSAALRDQSRRPQTSFRGPWRFGKGKN